MLTLALRNVFRHRMRTSITLAAIASGVVALVLSGGFVQDVFVQLGEALIHSQSGHMQVARAGYFTQGSRFPDRYVISDPDRIAARIRSLPGVDSVLERVQFSGLLATERSEWAVNGEGVEPAGEAHLGSYLHIVAGRQLTDRDRYAVLIGQGVASALSLAPGDHVNIVLNTVGGALNTVDFRVAGVFRTFSRDFDARTIRIPISAAHELLDSPRVNTLVVELLRTDDTKRIAGEIANLLRPGGLEVRTWVDLNDFYWKTRELYRQQFGFLQWVILGMVLLSVINTVNMGVFERYDEFGTMRALGNGARHVWKLIMVENIVLGLISSTIGVIGGVCLAWLISAVGIPMPPPPNANLAYTAYIRVVPSVIVEAFTVGLAATILAAALPAIRAARIPIVEALRAST